MGGGAAVGRGGGSAPAGAAASFSLLGLARQLFPRVVCTQLHGAGVSPPPDALPSYSMSMWLRTGFSMEEYLRFPLVFDRREPGREAQLAARHTRGSKPVLLAALESWT